MVNVYCDKYYLRHKPWLVLYTLHCMQRPWHVCPHAMYVPAKVLGISAASLPYVLSSKQETFFVNYGSTGVTMGAEEELVVRLLAMEDAAALLTLECANREFFSFIP